MFEDTTADPYNCLDIFILEEQSTWNINSLAVGVSFAIAFIVGGLLTCGCAKLCMKDFIRHKAEDAEAGPKVQHQTTFVPKQQVTTQSAAGTQGRRKRKRQQKRSISASNKDGSRDLLLPVILDGDGDDQNKAGQGFLNVLIKDSGVDMETELASQDFDALCQLEREFREQNIDTMLQLLRTLLNKQLKKGKLTPEQSQELLDKMQTNMDHVIKSCKQEKDEEQLELEKKIKDPEELAAELDKLNSKYNIKTTSMLQNEKENLRQNLMKVTDLTDDEIDEILAELTRNLANLENQLSAERMRQAKALEERLEKRRLLAKQQRSETKQQTEEIHHRVKSHDIILTKIVKDGKLQDRQKEEILSEYKKDLVKIQRVHEEEFQKQKLLLAEKLRHKRELVMTEATSDHENKKTQFFDSSESMTDTTNLVISYHQLLQQQRQELDDVNDELDEKEAEEIRKLSRGIEKNRNVEIQQREEQFEEDIRVRGQLTERDLDKLIAIHQEQMEEFDARKKNEKKRMKIEMEEKLQQRRLKVEEDQKLALIEQSLLREQQDATVEKVLQSQIEMSASDKEKIMKEHEQNISSMNNQLQMSRLKQQKLLEARINKRQAHLEDLKKQAEETKLLQKKDKEKQLTQLQKTIQQEEANIEEERKKAVIETRKRLVEETQLAFAEQEKQLGLLIARLQVGQARRQILIKKQDKTIKQLEEKLSSQVAEKIEEVEGGEETEEQVNQLLQQHLNQVSGLNDRLQDVKDRQNQILQEKLQRKRFQKEREVGDKLEREAQNEFDIKRKMGTLGKASVVLEQVMLDTRHKMAMHQLESDMQAEMKKLREQLNDELEADLQTELEAQKKSFLSQLAAIIDMSKEEVNELVTSAAAETGADSEEARKLAKDLRIGLKRAKSQLGIGLNGNRKAGKTRPGSFSGGKERPFHNKEDYENDEGGYHGDYS